MEKLQKGIKFSGMFLDAMGHHLPAFQPQQVFRSKFNKRSGL